VALLWNELSAPCRNAMTVTDCCTISGTRHSANQSQQALD